MRIIWHYVNGWNKAGHTLIQVDFLFVVRREQGLRPDQIRFVGRRGSGATPVGRANGHLSQQSTRTSLQLGLRLAQLCPHHIQVSPFKSPPGQLPSPQLQGHGGFQEDFLSRQDTAILSGTYTHKISEFSNSFLMNSSSWMLNLLILTSQCLFPGWINEVLQSDVILKSNHGLRTCSSRRFQWYPTTYMCWALLIPYCGLGLA